MLFSNLIIDELFSIFKYFFVSNKKKLCNKRTFKDCIGILGFPTEACLSTTSLISGEDPLQRCFEQISPSIYIFHQLLITNQFHHIHCRIGPTRRTIPFRLMIMYLFFIQRTVCYKLFVFIITSDFLVYRFSGYHFFGHRFFGHGKRSFQLFSTVLRFFGQGYI